MGKVVLSYSMSLDGFAAGPDVGAGQPMGRGGERLHEWLFKSEADPDGVDAQTARATTASVGAAVVGRRTYDVGLQFWKDVPYPAPSFVVTHEARGEEVMKSGVFQFVTGGVESAIARAKTAAGDKNVVVMGVSIAQQALKAGLVDEIQIHLIPVLLGGGARLFDEIGSNQIELSRSRLVESPFATHLEFQVVR